MMWWSSDYNFSLCEKSSFILLTVGKRFNAYREETKVSKLQRAITSFSMNQDDDGDALSRQ